MCLSKESKIKRKYLHDFESYILENSRVLRFIQLTVLDSLNVSFTNAFPKSYGV